MQLKTPHELSEAFAAAINEGDLDAAVGLWVGEAVLIQPDGSAISGHAALRDALGALIANGVDVEVEIESLFEAGDVAMVLGSLTMTGASPDGEKFRQVSRSVVVYSRGADGSWRVAIDAPWGLPST